MSISRIQLAVLLLVFPLFPSLGAAQGTKEAQRARVLHGRAERDKVEAKPLLETWQAAYFEGLKVGHTHTVAREVIKDGKKCIRTVKQMNLVVKRYGSVIPIRLVQVSDETADGKVLSLVTTQYLAKDSKVTMTGVVRGGKLIFTTSLDGTERELPWNKEATGQYHQEVIFEKEKVKAGDRFKLVTYEMLLQGALTIRFTVKDLEATDLLVAKKKDKGTRIVREPAKLLRVDAVPDKIMMRETEVQLPAKIIWLDRKLQAVREQFEMPGLGPLTFYSTTKEAALKEGVAPELLPDLGLKINIPLKQTIDRPYETKEAVYRVTLKEKLARVFAQDARQEVRKAKDKTFELVVTARREPLESVKPIAASEEYLESNQFIDSDNARIKATAKAAVGKETNAWRKAQQLERWVHDNMKVSAAVGFPSAGQICRNLEGDCRQHAILLTALCRAEKIPARTAVGLIYVRDPGRSPFFGFHMWTEVLVAGQWMGLDAILGQGGIAATHLKMADHSWSKTATLAPLLPVSQVLGKLQIEVVSAK